MKRGQTIRILGVVLCLLSFFAIGTETEDERAARYSQIYAQLHDPTCTNPALILHEGFALGDADNVGFDDMQEFLRSLPLRQWCDLPDTSLYKLLNVARGRVSSFDESRGIFAIEEQLEGAERDRWKRLLVQARLDSTSFDLRFWLTYQQTSANRTKKTYFANPVAYFKNRLRDRADARTAQEGVQSARRRLAALEDYALRQAIELEPDTRRSVRAAKIGVLWTDENLWLFLTKPEEFDQHFGLSDDSLYRNLFAQEGGTRLSIRLRPTDRIPVYAIHRDSGTRTLLVPRAFLTGIENEQIRTQERLGYLLSEHLPEGGYWIRLPEIDEERMFYFDQTSMKHPFDNRGVSVEVWDPHFSSEPKLLKAFPRDPKGGPITLAEIARRLEPTPSRPEGLLQRCYRLLARSAAQ